MPEQVSHTPGPWMVRGVNKDMVVTAAETVAIDCRGCGTTREVATANANLVAAAPELLAALKSYRTEHETGPLGCYRHEGDSVGDNAVVEELDHRCEECRIADDVIAKAEGRA